MLFVMDGFIVACGDDDGDDQDPTLTVSLVAASNTFAAGDTVAFNVSASDDQTVETIVWSNEGLNFNETITVNDSMFTAVASLILDSLTTADTYSIEFVATDNNDNTAEQTVDIVVE